MLDEEALRVLRSCGLTETEAKVYLALIKGKGDAKDLSARSRVPYSKIHTVLSSLREKSLIAALSGRPVIYCARGVGDGLGEYKVRLQKEIEERFRTAEHLLSEIQGAPEKSDIWIIKSNEEILDKVHHMLSVSKRDVKLSLPSFPESLSERVLPVLMRLRSQGVKVDILVTKDVEEREVHKLLGVSKVRRREKMFGGGLIVDDVEIMLFLGGSEGVIGTAIWASHQGLVQLARAYFDFLWSSSEEL